MISRVKMLSAAADVIMFPFVLIAGVVLWMARRAGLGRIPLCRSALLYIGVLPVRRHYYEPFFSARELRQPLSDERHLPGIDWNVDEQLALLEQLRYADELADLARPPPAGDAAGTQFHFNNGAFESGDAEYLYQIIRARKPRRIFEVGSGNSTLIAHRAVTMNQRETAGYACKHVCIEPYENSWLEKLDVTVLRKKIEDVDRALFQELGAGDLLFIDSSHVIRPQGDVVVEYLEILPTLRPGVIVHIHDVFSPRDYPAEWVLENAWLWNEQYLLEAILTGNESWKIIGALNLLSHRHFDALHRVCPFLVPDREPGSFYIQKLK
jgi:predicted O-methyltransferase YrrM